MDAGAGKNPLGRTAANRTGSIVVTRYASGENVRLSITLAAGNSAGNFIGDFLTL
jgi:hypothetical protein